MSILKAIFYTIGLVVIWSISQLLVLIPLKYYFLVELPSAFTVSTLGILSSLIAYFSVFYLFDIPKNVEKSLFKFKVLNKYTLLVLPFIAIALYLCNRVFWDAFNGLLVEAQAGKNNFIPLNYLDFNIYPRLLLVILISPILEELFFRKLLFAQLLKKYDFKIALLVSSLCFSSIHIETPHNLLATFFGGLILGTLFYKTKNIVYSILTHILFNAIIIFLGSKLALFFQELNYSFWYWSSFCFGLFLLFISFRYLIKNK